MLVDAHGEGDPLWQQVFERHVLHLVHLVVVVVVVIVVVVVMAVVMVMPVVMVMAVVMMFLFVDVPAGSHVDLEMGPDSETPET